jgi:hypothetical protein
MPGPLTYAAITLLARDRIGQIRDALAAKLATGRTINDIERQVQFLAARAHRMMSATQPAFPSTLRLYGPPLTDQVSKFLLLGALGPDLPRYAALFAPGQRWLFDTLHKGTADADREMVLPRSTDFVLEFWARVQGFVREEFSDASAQRAAMEAMQAYVLGHFCHVAADVATHPFFDEVEAHLGVPGRSRLRREQIASAVEVAVASRFFGRGVETRGGEWSSWWPVSGDVPSAFFKAYQAAIEQIYGPGGRRAKGFGRFEEQFAADQPPPLSRALLEDGYATFRTAVETGVAWDYWDWLGATWWMFLPALLAVPLAGVLPQGRNLFREGVGEDAEGRKVLADGTTVDTGVGTYEVVVFPFAATSILPLGAMILLSFSYLGVGREMVTGWISGGLQVAAAVGFFASLGGADAARWILCFALPVVAEILQIIHVLIRGSDVRRQQLTLSCLLHLGLSGLFALMYAAFLHKAVEGLADEGLGSGDFWGYLALWALILVALWFLTALLMRFLVTGHLPDEQASSFVTGRRHWVALFDDTTLFQEPRGTSPTLADLFYPSGQRPLLKLWWEGDDTPPQIRSDRDRLIFRFPPSTDQVILAPIAPTKASEFAAYLNRAVKDSAGNATQRLQARLAYPDTDEVKEDYELPSGEVFADHGDGQDSQAEHDTEAAKFRPLPGREADAHTLYHAPKERQAVRSGRRGGVIDEDRSADDTTPSGGLTTQADPRVIRRTAGADSLFAIFRPGDIVQTLGAAPAGGQSRVVLSVDADDQITVCCPFSTPLTGAAAGTLYKRAGRDTRVTPAAAPPGTVSSGPGANDLTGVGAGFGGMFRPGDIIRVGPAAAIAPGPVADVDLPNVQERVVVTVTSDSLLTVDEPFVPAVAAPNNRFVRVGDEEADGLEYLARVAPSDDTISSGETAINHAADLAALLCLGATSHLLTDAERRDRRAMNSAGSDLNRVYQVFRNWNLDRRRENEWKMLIAGGAVSEKRGDATALDSALAPLPAEWSLLAGKGEARSDQLGWVPLLRRWLDMARRPDTDTKGRTAFKAEDPTNLELSRALAYLLDMRDPDPVAP